jgi:hypothetical protein
VKKLFLCSVLAVIAAGGAFAQAKLNLSAGAGGYFTSDFGGGIEMSLGSTFVSSSKTPYSGGGGFAFLDAAYAELYLGFFGGGGSFKIESLINAPDRDFSVTGLDIGLLGKYPFAVNKKLTAFPLLGITYRAVLSAKDEKGNDLKTTNNDKRAGDLSALWFKLGGGVDYALSGPIYLRGEALYGLRIKNKYESDVIDSIKVGDVKALLGHGLEIKIAVGYKF